MTTSALEVAKWFIKNDLDNPRNKYDGNMKIQKLLYFAQLIHLALHGDVLFDDPILAYENGSVVEHVRQRYKNDNGVFVAEAKNTNIALTDKEKNTLILTAEIFGKLSASELSDLNHLHQGWREALERSKRNGFYYRENGVISMTSIKNNDLEKVKQMLKAHQSAKQINDNCEVINGITFYYDPKELAITDEIISILESFRGTESAYSISLDKNREIVIYQMNIVTGQALILSLPFADGGESAYRRPFLVIETDPINNKVKVLNVSSVAGKEDKLLWPSNENIDNYNPPFTRPTYVKLDVIYELEYSSELDSSIGFGGTVLNAIELGNIASKLGVFCGSHRFKSTYYNFSQIKHKTS